MHHARWLRHGDPNHVERDYSNRRYGLTVKQRLRNNSVSAGDCWEWQGHLLRGYGRILIDGELWLVHRASYHFHKGPIPDKYEIDHECGTRTCINPAHLAAVTRPEHARRETARRLDTWTSCKSGRHPYPENRIMEPSTGRTRCRECRREAQRKYKAKLDEE